MRNEEERKSYFNEQILRIKKNNRMAEDSAEFFTAPRQNAPGAFVVAAEKIEGSPDFPLRKRGQDYRGLSALPGEFLWFVWPSQRGCARGYIKTPPTPYVCYPEMCVFKISTTPPADRLVRWRVEGYEMYTDTKSLLNRARLVLKNFYYIEMDGEKMFPTASKAIKSALADLRFSSCLQDDFSNFMFLCALEDDYDAQYIYSVKVIEALYSRGILK